MRIFRVIGIFIVALSLSLSGITSHGHAKADPDHSKHHGLSIEKYADLAIDAEDCPHVTSHGTANHPSDDTACKKCCAACMTASLLPTPVILLADQIISRQTFTPSYDALVANLVRTEPDIPKSI
jgi:hypothetical protein